MVLIRQGCNAAGIYFSTQRIQVSTDLRFSRFAQSQPNYYAICRRRPLRDSSKVDVESHKVFLG